MAPEFFRIRRGLDGWFWTGCGWSPDADDAAIIRRQTAAACLVSEMLRGQPSGHGYDIQALKLGFTSYVKEDRV